jgi:hypothetical protein
MASGTRLEPRTTASGAPAFTLIVNPVVSLDEWAILSDGTVALVRGHDYHVDWIDADGSVTSTPRMPFDWRRLTDEDKQNLIDSARTAYENAMSAAASAGRAGPPGAGGGGGGGADQVRRVEAAVAGARGAGVAGPTVEREYAPLSAIPDYYPPIRAGAVRADADGNLWILPTTSAQSRAGELVYDVVNRKGEIFQRVRLPAGRSIAGFGSGGVVFLMQGSRAAGWHIERTHVVAGSRGTQ